MLVYKSLQILANFLEVLILLRIVMSFINLSTNNPIGHFVYEMTEPILGPARDLISKLGIDTGMFDFSPIVALFFINIILKLAYSLIF